MSSAPHERNHPGRCACGAVRYRLTSSPLFLHCCHCTYCQRESGSAFAFNAMIETARIELLTGSAQPRVVPVPSESGDAQRIHRCPECFVAVWSNYAGYEDMVRFVRIGTLDDPGALGPPDVYIFTGTKLPWIDVAALGADKATHVCETFYEQEDLWPDESLARLRIVMEDLERRRARGESMHEVHGELVVGGSWWETVKGFFVGY